MSTNENYSASSMFQHARPNAELQMHYITKSKGFPTSSREPIDDHHQYSSKMNSENEPNRFRTSLKIQLEKNESANQRSSTTVTPSHRHQQENTIHGHSHITLNEHCYRNIITPVFQHDNQAVYL